MNGIRKALCVVLALLILLCTGAGCMPALASSYSDLASDILDSLSKNDSKCTSAPQQAVNGAYRLTEMLAIVGYECAVTSSHTKLAGDVLDTLSKVNDSCSGAPQQARR